MSRTSRKAIVRRFIRVVVIGSLIGFILGYVDPMGRYYEIRLEKLWQEARELSRSGTLSEQRDAYEGVAEFTRKHIGSKSHEYARALQSLSLRLIHLDESKRAVVLLERAISIRRELYGEDSGWVALSTIALAQAELRVRNYAKAEILFLQGIGALIHDDESDLDLISALDGLASLYSLTGEREKATGLREYLVSRWRMRGSSPGVELRKLSRAYAAKGQYALAEQVFGEALAAEGKSKPDVASLRPFDLELLGELSLRVGRFEDAARYFSFLAARSVEEPSADMQVRLRAISSWATALIELGEIDLARSRLSGIDPNDIVLDTALDRNRAAYYYGANARATAMQGDAQAATRLISVARELMGVSDEQDKGGWELESVLNLAAAYRAVGQPDEAVAMLSAYLDDAEAMAGKASPMMLARVSSELAALHAMTGDRARFEDMNARARAYESAHAALQDAARRMEWRWEDIERLIFP